VVKANLIYTTNGGQRYEEWFKADAQINSNHSATVTLPKGTTHYLINLIDEYNFLVSYPKIPSKKTLKSKQEKYSKYALSKD